MSVWGREHEGSEVDSKEEARCSPPPTNCSNLQHNLTMELNRSPTGPPRDLADPSLNEDAVEVIDPN